MIDPINLTNYNRTNIELEEMILFSVLVAGKNAITTSKRMNFLLNNCHLIQNIENSFLPFECLRKFSREKIEKELYYAGIGCYRNKSRSIYELVNSFLNLKDCSCEDLENIYGIGPKTSRMFLLHSRPNQKLAVLDTHILKYMRDCGIKNVPKSTPSGKKYKELEKDFLNLAKKEKMTVVDFDLYLWRKYSGREVA